MKEVLLLGWPAYLSRASSFSWAESTSSWNSIAINLIHLIPAKLYKNNSFKITPREGDASLVARHATMSGHRPILPIPEIWSLSRVSTIGIFSELSLLVLD